MGSMALIRHIANQFSPVYLKPTTIARAVRDLAPVSAIVAPAQTNQQQRESTDRRCGVDRRQRNRRVMLDLRSAYPRRGRSGRRDSEGQTISIDVYA